MTFTNSVQQQITDIHNEAEFPPRHQFAQDLQTDLGKALHGFFRALALLADQKQQDYGSENLTRYGLRGVVIRLADKLARLDTLTKEGRAPARGDETVLDTLADGIVYQGIAYLLEAGLWPPKANVFAPGTLGDSLLQRKVPITGVEERAQQAEDQGDWEAAQAIRIGDWEDVITATEAVVRRLSLEDIPTRGRIYRDTRVPSKVRVDAIFPSYCDHSISVQVMVCFLEVATNQTVPEQLPTHLRVEPLEWFNKHYVWCEDCS